MSGFAAGRVRPQPLMRVHSTLIDKAAVAVTIQLGSKVIVNRVFESAASTKTPKCTFGAQVTKAQIDTEQAMVEVPLEQLAYARSGDKGNNANVGVIARKPEYLPVLYQQLTAAAVAEFFDHVVEGEVEHFGVEFGNDYERCGVKSCLLPKSTTQGLTLFTFEHRQLLSR